MGDKDVEELKKLNSEIAALESDIRIYTDTLSQLHAKLNQAKQRVDVLSREPAVSDHAFIRYLQRRLQIDTDAWKAEILTPDVRAAINMGAATVTIDGVEYRVKNKTIVTVVTND